MQVGHKLEMHCKGCETPIQFSVLDAQDFKEMECPGCHQRYVFDDKTLLCHLKQFEALCHQIHASEEILGSTAIAIDVGSHHVKVPFNILLTRMSSVIELDFDGEKQAISFRVEPLKDVSEALALK